MIVVLGRPALVPEAPGIPARPGGRAGAVALACATRGRRVELAGAIGDDPEGDILAVALGRAGIGHAALLRDPAARTPRADRAAAGDGAQAPRLDGGDVDLALRYLTGCHVLIVADPLPPDVATVAAEAAAWHAVPLVVLADPHLPLPAAWGPDAIVLGIPEAEDEDEDDAGAAAPGRAGADDPATAGAFPGLVADLAVALADGVPAGDALAGAIATARGERMAGR